MQLAAVLGEMVGSWGDGAPLLSLSLEAKPLQGWVGLGLMTKSMKVASLPGKAVFPAGLPCGRF